MGRAPETGMDPGMAAAHLPEFSERHVMPTPDELYPDNDPADWPMCDGTFLTRRIPQASEQIAMVRIKGPCPVCSQIVTCCYWPARQLVRVNFHQAPRRFAAEP